MKESLAVGEREMTVGDGGTNQGEREGRERLQWEMVVQIQGETVVGMVQEFMA